MNNRQMVELGEEHYSLSKEGLRVIRGWDDTLAQQLVTNSTQKEIMEWTPKDHTERFPDVDGANRWYREDPRFIYAMARAADLAGTIWFTKKSTEGIDAEYTFAIRMYDMARGKGLSEEFTNIVWDDFENQAGYRGGIWLETGTGNDAGLHLYQKLGYKVVSTVDGRVKMVHPGSKNRHA
jgi:hypothetical protein